MTNEQTAAMLYGIKCLINNAKYEVLGSIQRGGDAPLSDEAAKAYRVMEELEGQVTKQIMALNGSPI